MSQCLHEPLDIRTRKSAESIVTQCCILNNNGAAYLNRRDRALSGGFLHRWEGNELTSSTARLHFSFDTSCVVPCTSGTDHELTQPQPPHKEYIDLRSSALLSTLNGAFSPASKIALNSLNLFALPVTKAIDPSLSL